MCWPNDLFLKENERKKRDWELQKRYVISLVSLNFFNYFFMHRIPFSIHFSLFPVLLWKIDISWHENNWFRAWETSEGWMTRGNRNAMYTNARCPLNYMSTMFRIFKRVCMCVYNSYSSIPVRDHGNHKADIQLTSWVTSCEQIQIKTAALTLHLCLEMPA